MARRNDDWTSLLAVIVILMLAILGFIARIDIDENAARLAALEAQHAEEK